MPNVRQVRARRVLAAVLAIECIAGVFLLIAMVPTFPDPGPDQQVLVPIWIGLLISVIVSLVWVGVTLFGVLRTSGNWVKASSVVLHVLLFAAGAGVLQGIIGTPFIGGVLVVLAFVGFFSATLLRPAAVEPESSAPSSDAE